MTEARHSRTRLGLGVLIALVAVLAAAASVAKFRVFEMQMAIDNAYFLQRAWQAAAGEEAVRTLFATERGAGLLVGRHLDPILAITVPALWLSPRMESLLLCQAAALFGGAVAAAFLTRKLAGSMWLGTVLWLSSPVLWAIVLRDFRTLAFAAPAMTAALAAACLDRVWIAVVAAFLACACREEVAPFLLLSVGVAFVLGHKEGRRASGAVAAVSVAWMLMGPLVLGGGSDFLRFTRDGATAPDQIAQAPWLALFEAGLRTMGPLWLLGSAGPGAAVSGPHLLGLGVAHGVIGFESPHYFAPVLPALILGACWWWREGRWTAARRAALVSILVAQGAQVWATAGPWCTSGLRMISGVEDLRQRRPGAWEALRAVPGDVAVLASNDFTPMLAARPAIYALSDWRGADDHARVAAQANWVIVRPWEGEEWPWSALGYVERLRNDEAVVLERDGGKPLRVLTPGAAP